MADSRLLKDLPEVSNVCIFMADALRWDYLPDAVQERGVTVKTVAASLTTHTSLPTMITGLWPHRHQVLSWQGRLPDITHYLNHPKYETGYYQPGENAEQDGTFSILNIETRTSLTNLLNTSNNWLYFERHHGGHAPFNAIDPWDGSWLDWVDAYAGRPEKHQRDYKRAINATLKDFEARLQQIREAGELDDTLVIFCSDHGEYLGERGLVGHSSPIGPEGVYVPTVFIHPDLPRGTTKDGIMRHVDLYPTDLRLLEKRFPHTLTVIQL